MADVIETVAFATKHGKAELLNPLFSQTLGWSLITADVDTDEFGTFAGEVDRKHSPRETVLAKARAGALRLGVRFGMASEGSIGMHPQLPLTTSNLELLAVVDVETGFEFVERHLSPAIVAVSAEYEQDADLEQLYRRADLPNHALIVRAETERGVKAIKGLRESTVVSAAIAELVEAYPGARLTVESDFRAMNSPSRQANILACAEKLAARLRQRCPSCDAMAWGVVEYERGLPCNLCGELVAEAIRAEVHGCPSCDFRKTIALDRSSADARYCHFCNP